MKKRITIKDARDLAKRLDCQAVMVLAVERDGTVRVTTYGESKFKCRVIGEWAKGLWNECISIIPFQTAFGWGNGGKPRALSDAEESSLPRNLQEYAARNTARNAEAELDTMETK